MSQEIRDYFVRLEGEEPEDLEPVSADAPIRAAQEYSRKRQLEPGAVVEVKSAGGRFRAYVVGPNPRVLSTLGSRAGVTVR